MGAEKQFEATASRLEKAKREGDVARSQEAGATAAFACGLAAAAFVVPCIGLQAAALVTDAAAGRSNRSAYAVTLALMLAPAAAAAFGSGAISILQGGGLRFVAIRFKAERLSPAENLKRMISRETAIAGARGIVAFCCAAIAIVPAAVYIWTAALRAGGIIAIGWAAWSSALRTAFAVCIVGGLFALADYGVQFARWRRRLRMSADELKRDQKEQDGDPLARGKRRSFHRQIARGSLRRVKDAAFVVANPTHIAMALEYRPPEVPVPRVLVRSADEAALRVREIAARHGIPIVEHVPLARMLYSSTKPGEYIPQASYIAVAEIVSRLRGVLSERSR